MQLLLVIEQIIDDDFVSVADLVLAIQRPEELELFGDAGVLDLLGCLLANQLSTLRVSLLHITCL